MQSWKHESLFVEYIAQEDLLTAAFRLRRRSSSVDPTKKSVILQNAAFAMQSLRATLSGHELELHYINQLLVYVQQLQGLGPIQTPEQQFNHLYLLRKWLFWVPISLLQRPGGQGPAMLTLAHFYAVALTLEPLFPDLGSFFCSATALSPLEAIIAVTDGMQSEHTAEIASLMQFPRHAAYSYRTHAMQIHQAALQQQQPFLGVNPDTLSYASIGNLSPAFAPSTPHYSSTQPTSAPASYLEVPSHPSFTSGTQAWGLPSPSLSAQSPSSSAQLYTTQEENMYGYIGGIPTTPADDARPFRFYQE
ncbi:hypothetical protein LTR02_001111 [Friedmanniomyces endolithicus]|nr:hypothetical protein LTR94_002020 [Friedmanniomyces endolithicus]KAK0819834.1 hypothetical protein LTR38_000589 [Friedmanniomyces endolithicus]KAK0821924.1 hypothetical protein LTR75_000057 [Friedmanniomyces endolithicus]KAK0845983.1 hypothetical protein LTR03_007190 [Friedmanniomyces endolithicus]KAK0862180.1 hypothetical protein LTR87_016686 [Friedmanniomyces endolithicus]